MRSSTATGLLGAAVLAALSAVAAPALRAGEKGVTKIDPKVVAEQKTAAVAHYKKVFGEGPPQMETAHFLLLGKVEGRTLKDVGETLEKAYTLAAKALELDKQEPWPGKLTVYFALDRRTFAALVRAVERRRPEPDEHGSVVVRSDTPSVISSPGKGTHELNAELEAAAQVGSALLRAKGGERVPGWLAEGFGRATAFQAGPAELLAQERRRAYAAVVAKRAATAAWGDTLREEEAAVVRSSLMEYMGYSGKIMPRIFLSFVTGFRPREDGQPVPTPEAILSGLNVSPVRLSNAWALWVRSLR